MTRSSMAGAKQKLYGRCMCLPSDRLGPSQTGNSLVLSGPVPFSSPWVFYYRPRAHSSEYCGALQYRAHSSEYCGALQCWSIQAQGPLRVVCGEEVVPPKVVLVLPLPGQCEHSLIGGLLTPVWALVHLFKLSRTFEGRDSQ